MYYFISYFIVHMKKLFSIIATVALLAGFIPQYASAASYSAELEGAYAYAYGMGVTTMDSIDKADMNGNLTRVALAKMISNYVLDLGLQTPDTSKKCSFSDVSTALDTQYDNWVTNACQLGLMGVGIEKFNPNGIVTRAEFGTVLSRALWGDLYDGANPYYADHLNALKEEGIMTNISNPNMTEVRGYVMLMMQRADTERKPAICMTPENIMACLLELDSCPAECKGDDEEVVVLPGFLTISKVSAPSQQEVARNASLKNVGTIKLTAGQNGATVSSLVVSRSGLGSNNVSVQLAKDWKSITSARTMNSNGEAIVRFSPAIVLKANESMNFDVLVSLTADQNEVHSFTVTSANIVNGTVSGTATLGSLRTTSYSVSTFTANQWITTVSIQAWETKAIARVQLTAGIRDAMIKWFTLSKVGWFQDLDKSFSNVKAYVNNQEVWTVTITRDKIFVSGLNIEKTAWSTATIEIRATGIYIGSKSDTIVGFDSISDIDVVEKDTMEAIQLFAEWNTNTVTLDAVDVTVTKKSTGSQTVAPGTANVVLYDAEIKSSAEFDVIEFELVRKNALTDLTNTRVILNVNGSPVEITEADFAAAPAGKKVFTVNDRFTVSPNSPVRVTVTANISSDDTFFSPWTPFNHHLFTFVVNKIRDVENSSNVIDLTLTPISTPGDTTTIKLGSVELKDATVAAPSSRNIWTNASNVEVARFALKWEAENVTVNKITFNRVAGIAWELNLTHLINSAKLVNSKTDAVVAQNGKIEAGKITFESVSITAEKDVDLDLKLVVDTKSFKFTDITVPANRVLSFNTVIAKVDTNRASGGEANINATITHAPAIIYNIGIKSPDVTLTKKDASTFTVTVKNNDTESDLVLENVTVRVKPVADNTSYKGNYCLRPQGSSVTDCANLLKVADPWDDRFSTIKDMVQDDLDTLLWTTKMIPGSSRLLVFNDAKTITKGSTYTFEVYVDSNFVNPPTLMAEFTRAGYNTTASENYQLSAQ